MTTESLAVKCENKKGVCKKSNADSTITPYIRLGTTGITASGSSRRRLRTRITCGANGVASGICIAAWTAGQTCLPPAWRE